MSAPALPPRASWDRDRRVDGEGPLTSSPVWITGMEISEPAAVGVSSLIITPMDTKPRLENRTVPQPYE